MNHKPRNVIIPKLARRLSRLFSVFFLVNTMRLLCAVLLLLLAVFTGSTKADNSVDCVGCDFVSVAFFKFVNENTSETELVQILEVTKNCV